MDDLAEPAVESLRHSGRRFAPEAGSVREIRDYTAEVLRDWDLDHLSGTVRQLVSELATNALRHGHGFVEVRLIRGDRLTCEVLDSSCLLPELRFPGEDAESGRGIQLVSLLADRWGCRPLPTGKAVWFDLDLRPSGDGR
ncbi:ATP-binding protein [Actinocorallia longicatena]|uniref:Histidine kinase/HSP90-like ATPase domain-containing protein n=1 Tax=Actinocorallia longicatena TaxID=111803 RepID=A0ABP6Q8T4_9ACTN